MIDPRNPVAELCARGMEAESGGNPDLAARLFLEAWERAADDYEACIAAHYVARHQSEPGELLRWNQVALARADRVADDRVAGFYPSLQLNLGFALERNGDRAGARDAYLAASALVERLPEDRYGEMVRDGIRRALAWVGAAGG